MWFHCEQMSRLCSSLQFVVWVLRLCTSRCSSNDTRSSSGHGQGGGVTGKRAHQRHPWLAQEVSRGMIWCQMCHKFSELLHLSDL